MAVVILSFYQDNSAISLTIRFICGNSNKQMGVPISIENTH